MKKKRVKLILSLSFQEVALKNDKQSTKKEKREKKEKKQERKKMEKMERKEMKKIEKKEKKEREGTMRGKFYSFLLKVSTLLSL